MKVSVLFHPRILVAALATGLALAMGLSSCSLSGSSKPSVVLIIIDTLRADHLGFMGYPQAKTPNLDALAKRGTVFSRAVTTAPITLPSITSILTGRIPPHHGVRDNERFTLPDKETTLTERFQEAGYRTGAVVASAVLSSDRGLAQGFEIYDDTFEGPYASYLETKKLFEETFAKDRRRADTVTDKALGILDGFGDDPYFLMVHYFDVHAYYDPPPEYSQMHPGRPYDGEISFVDAQIARILKRVGKDAVIVVLGDHGEGLGEHGEMEHGFYVYQSTLHVPLVVAGPDVPKGLNRSDPVSLVDLEPTLGNWLNLPNAPADRDGRTLTWDAPVEKADPLYAETFHTVISYNWAELQVILEGKWKLIEGAGVTELYDLSTDPKELKDLGAVEPVPHLREHLTEMTGGQTREDVLNAMKEEVDPERREMLESLGYIGTTTEKSDKPRVYPHPRDQLPAWVQRQRTKSMYTYGLTLALRQEYKNALAIFDSVVTRGKIEADVLYNRAVTHWKLGDNKKAESDLAWARKLDEKHVPSLALLADFDRQAGRMPQAYDRYIIVHELEPENVGALRFLSNWHLLKEDLESALPLLRALVNTEPEDANARYNLGLAAAKSDRSAEAREHLEKFLQLSPGDPRAGSIRETIRSLTDG